MKHHDEYYENVLVICNSFHVHVNRKK